MVRQTLLALFILLSGGGCAALQQGGPTPPQPLPYGVDFCFLHPVKDPGPHVTRMAAAVPQPVKDHVYVYFVNGFDPLYVGNFKGLSNYVKSLGFCHCYCGEMTHTRLFRNVIRKVRREDPAARIVLVGYSAGANCVRDLAEDLRQDRIGVDLLVYVGGDTIRNVKSSWPGNVGCVLNITGHGLVFLGYDLICKGCDIDGASNQRLNERHMLLPSRPQTAELLVQHLVAICNK